MSNERVGPYSSSHPQCDLLKRLMLQERAWGMTRKQAQCKKLNITTCIFFRCHIACRLLLIIFLTLISNFLSFLFHTTTIVCASLEIDRFISQEKDDDDDDDDDDEEEEEEDEDDDDDKRKKWRGGRRRKRRKKNNNKNNNNNKILIINNNVHRPSVSVLWFHIPFIAEVYVYQSSSWFCISPCELLITNNCCVLCHWNVLIWYRQKLTICSGINHAGATLSWR